MARSPPPKTKPDSSRITRPRNRPRDRRVLRRVVVPLVAAARLRLNSRFRFACDDWRAEISAVEGIVEVQRAHSDDLDSRRSRATCSASAIPCECKPSAARSFGCAIKPSFELDERIHVDAQSNRDDGIGSLIDLIRGVIHVISRDPRSLRFTTPYANAGLEGTEFDIRVTDEERRTEIAVLEGVVVVTNPMGEIKVPSDFVASAREGEVPVARAIVEPIELMRWASYFPEIFATDLPEPDQDPRGRRNRRRDLL